MERYSDPDRIFSYEYRAVSRSLFDRVFRYWLNYFFRFVPPTMSANLLSMIGNVGSWLALSLMIGFGASDGSHYRLVFLVAALGVLFYHTADNLDGRQARRLGASGPLGEFVDHWFDSFNVFFFPLGTVAAFPVVPVPWSLAIILLAGLADWSTLRVVCKTNEMYFGPVSTDEGIFVYWAFLFSIPFVGYPFWATVHPVLGFPPVYALIILIIFNFCYVIISNLIKYKGMGGLSLLVEALVVSPILLWVYVSLPVFGRQVTLIPALLLLGFTCSRHVGDLLRARLVGLEYAGLYPDMILCSLFLLAVSLVHRFVVQLPPWLLLLPLVVYMVNTLQALVLQFVRTTRRVYDCLGITLFGCSPGEKVVVAERFPIK